MLGHRFKHRALIGGVTSSQTDSHGRGKGGHRGTAQGLEVQPGPSPNLCGEAILSSVRRSGNREAGGTFWSRKRLRKVGKVVTAGEVRKAISSVHLGRELRNLGISFHDNSEMGFPPRPLT